MTEADERRDDAEGYAAALTELETILGSLEEDDVDVDVLASSVGRAAELIRFCRGRIVSARLEVERVVADLEASELTLDLGEASE